MSQFLKLLSTLYVLFHCYGSLLSQSLARNTDSLASYDIDAHKVQSKLEDIKQDKLACFYRQGVNDASFQDCCGLNYERVEKSFVNQYRILIQQLEDSFNRRISEACVTSSQPCEELSAKFSDSVRYNKDIYKEVLHSKKQIEASAHIDKTQLDTAFNRFETNYKALANARILISKEMSSVVEDVQNFINESGINLNEDYMTFKPKFVFGDTHDTNKMNDEHFAAIQAANNSFNGSLLGEADAKKMLTYYLSNGFVKYDDLDRTSLPSEQLRVAKSIIEARKQKVEL